MGDTEVTDLARRRQTRLLAGGLALYAVLLPIGCGIGFLWIDEELDGDFWLFLLLMAGLLAVHIVPAVVFVLWRRRRGVRWAQPPLLMGVYGARRASVIHSIRAGQPVEARDQEVAIDVAHRMAARRHIVVWFVPVYVLIGIALLVVLGWASASIPVLIASITVLFSMAVMLVSSRLALRNADRGRVWLEQHSS
ncbi:hypothetical protein [Kineosporia sp. NBRC 101731]|uniref:hypothetical protein n=1 Tax=Kineosporia sp. NBRC 101731 TaxID=3032199 RepID=UPI0024A4F320|nr:hypothetical protein [Kineosporia sp. NBRC 101731]GLY29534.1 hypothetical protein Kisp02_28990 [Kineosporia sp. NBRC 101731]